MTTATISTLHGSTVRTRPAGVEGAVYRLGMTMVVWARARGSRTREQHRALFREDQARDARERSARSLVGP